MQMTGTNITKEILNAIAPHGPHSAKNRLYRMGCMRFVELPQGEITCNVRSHQWDGVRITPEQGGAYTMKLWRSYRVPDLRNSAHEPYREETHNASSLKELGKLFKEAFLETRFRTLIQICKANTREDSSMVMMNSYTSYQEILSMKEKAIPLLLQELRDNGGHWFEALRVLTKAQPVPNRYRGNVALMTTAWLQWGQENGYTN